MTKTDTEVVIALYDLKKEIATKKLISEDLYELWKKDNVYNSTFYQQGKIHAYESTLLMIQNMINLIKLKDITDYSGGESDDKKD